MAGRPWTEQEEITLRQMVQDGKRAKEIAVALNRTVNAIEDRAMIKGLSFLYARYSNRVAGRPSCGSVCANGNRCCLRGDVAHELHMCRIPGCHCKSDEFFREQKARRNATP